MMKKLLLICLNLFIVSIGISQISSGGEPVSKNFLEDQNIKSVILEAVSKEWIQEAARTDGKNGNIERVAKNIPTNLNPYNSGTWETLLNGDKLWRLEITATGALGINAIFKDFSLAKGSKLFLYSPGYKQVIGAFNETNNHESKLFSTEIIFGNTLIIEYLEPKSQANKGFFTIEHIGSFYKSVGFPNQDNNAFKDSEFCEVNVNCSPEGTNWQDEKKGVARILVFNSSGQGWCTGTLVNNTNADCKPYFLTAYHCGNNSSTANFNNWIFYFNFEFSGCSSSSTSPSTSQSMTGATLRARSNNLNSTASSDFLLLELNQNVPTSYDPYYNGWNRLNSAPNGGVGIHHPAGDVKKISTFTATPYTVGVSWSNNGGGYTVTSGSTHWSHAWSSTTNGHGVTEGGSSGSPLFNNAGLVVGTLTGGGSYCNNTSRSDQYGKISYHWESNATANNRRLKPWLDPTNSNVTTLAGTYPPFTIGATDYAGITAVNEPTGTICGTTISPEVELKNFGTNNLTSVTINYQINSLALQSFSWTGNLAPNATTTVTLANMVSPVGANTFTATTNLPNGNTDNNSVNNSTTENYIINAIYNLPVQENFEATTFPPSNWLISNGDNDKTWEHSTTSGTGTGTKSMFIDNWDYNAVNQLDWLVSQTYDFSAVTNPNITYDLAYAYYYDQISGTNVGYDTLGIAVSTNCGASFYWLWKQGGIQLATAGGLGVEFIPTATDWQNKTLDLASLIGESSVQFAFIAKNGYGNNLYVDNINISSVAIPTPPVAEFISSATSICIGQSITFTDQTTNTPTSWAWNFGGGASNSTTQNPNVVFNTAGTYAITLTATNAGGSDSEVKTNYITVNPDPVIGSFTTTNLACNGDNSGQIIVNMTSGQAPYTYTMNSGLTGNNNTYTGLSAGPYTFTVADNNGCTTANSTTLTEPSLLSVNPINIDPSYCNLNNGSITLNSTGGTSGYSYALNGGLYQTNPVFNNLPAGNYNATTIDANGCITGINVLVNNINESFTITVQTTNSGCGISNGSAAATVNGSSTGYTYLWDNNQTTTSASGLSFGMHSVTLTNTNGCSETSTFNIGNTNAPIVTVHPTNILCNGQNTGAVTATISGGAPAYDLNWSFGGDSLTETNLGQGDYTLTVIDNLNCRTDVSFSITEPPALIINFNKEDEHCYKEDGKIEVIMAGGKQPYHYTWDNLATGNINNQLSAGSYTVTIIDDNNCAVQTTSTITNIKGPTANNVIITDVNCANEANGQILIDVINGSNPIQTNWSNGSFNEDLLNVTAGNYTVSFIDSFGCSSDSTFTITEPDPLTLSLNIIDNSPGGESTITANAFGGTQAYDYLWSTGSQTQVISNLSTGTYSLTVSDAKNCSIDTTISIGNVAIENTEYFELINLYPNPSSHVVNLKLALKNVSDIKITILNTLGQKMYYKLLNIIDKHTEYINVNNFANGVYYIEIEVNNKTEILKFVKVR